MHRHTPTHIHAPIGPNLPRSPAHQVELPAHSPAPAFTSAPFLGHKPPALANLGFQATIGPSDSRLGCDGGLTLQVDRVQSGKELTCVSTLLHHRRLVTSPGTADLSWTYIFDIIHIFYKVLFFSIWGSVEVKAEITLTLITQLD